jgi:Na+/phosphate symporter
VSFVLEMMKSAGRQFAKYGNTINQRVSVEKQQVEHYERNMEREVFDRLRAGVYNYASGADKKMGELGDRLRNLSK